MPTKVTPQQPPMNSHGGQSRASSHSRNDDSGSGAEGPARKRLQKTPSNAKKPEKRVTSASTAKPVLSSRRRASSIRDQNGPQGPRPPAFSPSKRSYNATSCASIVANATSLHSRSVSSNIVPPSNENVNPTIPDTNKDPRSRAYSINHISRFSFASINQGREENRERPADSVDFLAPVNFDDLHNSIATDEPSLNNFPLPGRGGGVFGSATNEGRSFGGPQLNGGQNGVQPSSAAQITRSGSLVRRPSNSTRATGTASIAAAMATSAESMGPPATQSNLRTRRQSHYPPSALNNANRTPRKSVGPGILTSTVAEPTTPRRRPSVAGKKNSLDQQRPEESTLAVRLNNRSGEQARVDGSSFLSTTRSAKAKSLQPPSRDPRGHLGTPIRTPDHSRSSSTNAARTPGRSAPGTNTPSSSKRMSVMPAHATGLGARTISPTDARRLKRLSTMQAPPMPYTPPTPQPDIHHARPRSRVQSPSMIPRKSVTPSSSRTTPDPNRKSYSSGLSLSSNTSYNSFRNSNGSMQPKLPQGLSSSRLPTPKPRLENLGGNNEEEVPPVPAIPKAYESPRNEVDQPFFSVRKSSLGYDANFANFSAQSTPTTNLADPWNELGESERTRSRESTPYEPESKPKPMPNIGKKNLQPLRLPPLNLLPLSTPTASRIAALHDFSTDPDQRAETPPRQVSTKTPSTPMTASKATFSRTIHDEGLGAVTQMRSSSTHFALRSDSSGYRAPSSSSTNVPSLDSLTGPRTMSPFLSSSLPKTSAEFNYVRPKFSGEYNRANFGTGRLTGPRAQTASQTLKDEPLSELSSPTEPETQQSSTSLRHKFSLTRKRSLVKDKNADKANSGPNPPKYDSMPPPKLPASATWSNLAQHSTSPVPKSNYLKSRRKTSAGSVGPNRSATDISYDDGDRTENADRENSMNRAASMFAPMQKMLGPKNPGRTRSGDSNLDRDDLLAEDEMKKLGAKRKDFEIAARELDELYRRATPKDGVSPPQALRMVNLNIFERGEIVDYPEVYFCGTQSAKKRVGDLKAEGANFGYDDERGDYQIVDGDHLSYRYEVVDILGKGSFGQVVRCVDHKTGGLVAIKIIRNKKRFHQQALVEVNILQKLKEWDPQMKHSVVNFTQNFYFRGHLCISTELLGMNLYEFIKAHDFRGFSLKLIRRFTKQLLASLVLLNGHKVIHCDLKPENVLLAHPMHSEIKVIDFGSSCFENEKVYTYIQSRFYRSPEVILGMSYGMPIDMWSLGCILAELFTGYPIFPGENEQEQLACIMEIFGPPEKHLIEKSSRKKLFFDSLGKPRLTVSSKGRRRRPSSKELRQALKCDDEAFLDFIARCLRWDPARRLSPQEALIHEFVTGVKFTPRIRPQLVTSNSSPIKRVNSITTPATSRPLPEPPVTSFKNGSAVRTRDLAGNSPVKPVSTRRQSTINGMQTGAGVKRASNGAAISSSALPRVPRTASGKPDLAIAAAATSLKSR